MTLLELAERCEAATDEQEALLLEAGRLLLTGDDITRFEAEVLLHGKRLDAAMTLVPEGWTAWELRSRRKLTAFVAEISRLVWSASEDCDIEEVLTGRAATPALAACAASLRARAAQEGSQP